MEKNFSINAGGVSIHCRMYAVAEHQQIQNVVLACHGFAGTKESKAFQKLATEILYEHKTTALLCFDWPCHGEDRSPKLTLDACMQYLDLVLDYIRTEIGASNIYSTSISFGGYMILKYIAERGNPFVKSVLRCPSVNMYESLTQIVMSPEDLVKLNKAKFILAGFDRKVRTSKVFLDELEACDIRKTDFSTYADDLLIIHGTKDEIVPLGEVRAFADANGIECVEIENADHRFSDPSKMSDVIFYSLLFYSLDE